MYLYCNPWKKIYICHFIFEFIICLLIKSILFYFALFYLYNTNIIQTTDHDPRIRNQVYSAAS